jgi:superfamily II DNA or RNA helicase
LSTLADKKVEIFFDSGTILLDGDANFLKPVLGLIKFDSRVKKYRARACDYAKIVLKLYGAGIPFEDKAKSFAPVDFNLNSDFQPLPHQQEALDAWVKIKGRGLVVMPTGSGKSYFAVMVMNKIKRPTLIVVPTIDLMQQWASQLESFFGMQVGMLGGGSKEIREVTVSTYDSAVLQMEFIGDRFGLIIFDECHHLPGPVNKLAATMSLAPYRLGLTATPEREDDGEEMLADLIGPLAYRIHIDELEGNILADYRTVRLNIKLDPDEQAEYDASRKIYTNFLRTHGITFRQKNDWSQFIIRCAKAPNGRKVLEAYLSQKRIARRGRSKFKRIWDLLNDHAGERIIIFTADNETAYDIGKSFFLPVITHRTKIQERKDFLDSFRQGVYPVLVTSKVLNEGVDVPEASVGIVVSGSGSIREHVQRLGRILRGRQGKEAVLYELVSEGTSEENVSRRRREHRAYSRYGNWRKK